MVPSKAEAKNAERNENRKEPIQVTESDENETVTYVDANGANDSNGSNGENGHTNGQTVSNGTANGTSNTNGSNSNDSQHKQNDETTN